MADFDTFKHGGVTFPLPLVGAGAGGDSDGGFLRDADPALFYMLEFFASIIQTHVGARFMQEVAAAGIDITTAVAMTMPFNVQPYLNEGHFQFPLLAIWRERGAYEYMGHRKIANEMVNCAFILPPLESQQAERLLPLLHAVAAVIDNRSERGFDPSYTPTTPVGVPGEPVWGAHRAGLKSVEVKSIEYGDFPSITDLSFPAVVLRIEVKERSEDVIETLQPFDGVSGDLDLASNTPGDDPATIPSVVSIATYAAPTVSSLSPNTGSKAGATPVTVIGTGFIAGRTYRVLFGGSDASSVMVVSATAISCITPQYIANPTAAVNVRVIDQDNQVTLLTTGFTFTSP